jgi:hypothetical protein
MFPVLLWDTYTLASQPCPDPKNVQEILESLGVSCLLDDSHKGLLNHPLMAHHQKTAVVDSDLSKTTIVDDAWLTLGSANLNNRGMRDDTEMNVAIAHFEMVRRLRILLMAEHLGLCQEDLLFRMLETMGRVQSHEEFKKSEIFTHSMKRWFRQLRHPNEVLFTTTHSSPATEQFTGELAMLWEKLESQLGDPFSGLALFAKQAKKNLLAVKAYQPLMGHLLPYIPHDLGQNYEVNVHAVNGWLDTLSAPQKESASTESASTP